MASTIDPTKPEDGLPASKGNLRANLLAAKTEIDHGGFAEGFSPSNYPPPATTQVKDHLAAVDSALGSISVGVDPSVASVNAFGAVGNGVADTTAQIQAALDSGAATVYFPPGTYKVTSQLTVTPGTTILGSGPGQTIIDATTGPTSGNDGVFRCSGTTLSLPALASSITEADGSIAYASSVASLIHGDWVQVYDSTPNSFGGGADTFDGFTYGIKAASGSTAYPQAACLRTLPAARTGGPLSNVLSLKLDPRGLVVRDLTVRGSGFNLGPDDGAAFAHIFYCLRLANIYFDRVQLLGAGGACILLERCANGHVSNSVLSTHTGQYNNAIHYACLLRGSAYCYLDNTMLYGQRSSLDMENRLGPAHSNIVSNCTLGGPGTDIFSQPAQATTFAFGWHQGTFHTLVTGCDIEGRIAVEGFGHSIVGCHIRQSKAQAVGLLELGTEFGPPGDFRFVGNKIYLSREDFRGSSGGMMIMMSNGSWDQDGGEAGSLVIANNDIYVMVNTTQPLIYLRDSDTKSPATGVFHVTGNRIAHKVGASTTPLCDIAITDAQELVVAGNVLPATMALGSFGTTFLRRVLSPNTLGGHLVMTGLPTSSPGGSGRLWSDGGTLKIT